MKKKILIVEDDKFLIRTYGYRLETSGYEIFRLEDGVDVLALAKEKQPNLIILDIVMPNRNGFEVLRDLNGDPSTKKIPVLVVSNLSQQKDIDEASRLGAVKYLVKVNTSFQYLKEIIDKQLAS